MRKILLLLFIFIINNTYSQTAQALRAKIASAPNDSVKIENMVLLADLYLQRQEVTNRIEAKNLMQEALSIANNPYTTSLTYIMLAKISEAEGNQKEAKANLSLAEKQSKKLGITPDKLMQLRSLKMAYQKSEEANAKSKQEIERAKQEFERDKEKYEQDKNQILEDRNKILSDKNKILSDKNKILSDKERLLLEKDVITKTISEKEKELELQKSTIKEFSTLTEIQKAQLLNQELEIKNEKLHAASITDSLKIIQQQKSIQEIRAKQQKNMAVISGIAAGLAIIICIVLLSLVKKIKRNNKEISLKSTLLEAEKRKSDSLLLNILPEELTQELMLKNSVEAKNFDAVTVLFTDFVGFTSIAEKLTPGSLVAELDYYFKSFDAIIDKYKIEKIKTIGDAYFVVSGLPIINDNHPVQIINAAFEILLFVEQEKVTRIANNVPYFDIRIGINTGPVVAGIVGNKKFAYDIWGDTVNTGSRMEQNAETNTINISAATFQKIKNIFPTIYRGSLPVKNKGSIDMYFIDTEKMKNELNAISYQKFEQDILQELQQKIAPELVYHSIDHTKDVLKCVAEIAYAEGVSPKELLLLKTAALLHDSGFMYVYKDHEEKGCEIAAEKLPAYGYTQADIKEICGMIMATRIPQTPTTVLEQILCDADLDYFGRNDYKEISENLFIELKNVNKTINEKQWVQLQIDFLKNHQYFTLTSKNTRDDKKAMVLKKLMGHKDYNASEKYVWEAPLYIKNPQ